MLPYMLRRQALLNLIALFLAVSLHPAQASAGWSWIWSPDGDHPPETLYFRQKFTLPKRPISAQLLITADDSYTAYLNQRRTPVAAGNDWTVVQQFDVTHFLKAGTNLFAVECRNQNGPGGLLYRLIVHLPNKRTLTFISGKDVRVTRHPPVYWTSMHLSDRSWPSAIIAAPAGGSPWGALHGALSQDYSRIVRIWNIHAGTPPGSNPYSAPREQGARMIMSSSMAAPSDLRLIQNAGFTLFQTDSDHLSTEETAPGKWDWNRQIAAYRLAHSMGLDWSYFEHEAFPPPWYRKNPSFTPIECMEHHLPVQAFSIWDKNWLKFIENGYQETAKIFGPKLEQNGNVRPALLSALIVGVHGDYGQAGLLTGGRVLVPAQRADWLKRFGNTHDHLGFWCADPMAEANFREEELKKYHSLNALNTAWHTAYTSPDQIEYPTDLNSEPELSDRIHYLDFIEWYRASVGRAIQWNLGAARKYFPNSPLLLPAGFADEDLRGGNDNSMIPKLAARYAAATLSYHGGAKAFAQNAATELGRLASAARFYGSPLWIATPAGTTPNQTVERIYEAASQGASGYFDWAENTANDSIRSVYYRYSRYLTVDRPVTDLAMFYPARAQEIRPQEGFQETFARGCAELRDAANFDIVDDRMVDDGCLSNYRILALWEGTICEPNTLEKIKEWVENGGVLLCYDFGKVTDFSGSAEWFKDMFGYVQSLDPAQMHERYAGELPDAYQIPVGQVGESGYLVGEWAEPDTESGILRRWTGASASIRLPVHPHTRYILTIRAQLPPGAAGLRHQLLVNGQLIGNMDTQGDVSYRFLLPDDLTDTIPTGAKSITLLTLNIQSETFQPQKTSTGLAGAGLGALGVHIESIGVSMIKSGEPASPPVIPGRIRSRIDLDYLNAGTSNQSWVRRYGKGLTIYFPATRTLLKGYLQTIRYADYNLSDIDPERKNALLVDNVTDGVYATLFPDKILYYNSTNADITRKISIPQEAFSAWKDQITTPSVFSWNLHLSPHSIAVIYFTPPPSELLFECEGFTDPNSLKPMDSPDCSPGSGPTCIRVPGGDSISTRIRIETAGSYEVFVRALRGETLTPPQILVDGQPLTGDYHTVGDVMSAGTISLSAGVHTLALQTLPHKAVRADFVLFSNDPDITGYAFALQSAPVN